MYGLIYDTVAPCYDDTDPEWSQSYTSQKNNQLGKNRHCLGDNGLNLWDMDAWIPLWDLSLIHDDWEHRDYTNALKT
jgi:hypothetical protein